MAGSDTAVTLPSVELIFDDGEPMESAWHREQMFLLIDVLRQAMLERGRRDFYAGGNQFVYFSIAQANAVLTRPLEETRHFRGPDVFWVGGVAVDRERQAWVVWEEDGRYPDLLIELLSPSTAHVDRTTKKDLYERTFRTPDYFLYERGSDVVEGFHLVEGRYQPVEPDERGRSRVASLDLWLGTWTGVRSGMDTGWIRLFDGEGRRIPTAEEHACGRADAMSAEAEASRAEAEALRTEAEALRTEAVTLRTEAEALRAEAEAERRRTEAEAERAAAATRRAEAAEAEAARLLGKPGSDKA